MNFTLADCHAYGDLDTKIKEVALASVLIMEQDTWKINELYDDDIYSIETITEIDTDPYFEVSFRLETYTCGGTDIEFFGINIPFMEFVKDDWDEWYAGLQNKYAEKKELEEQKRVADVKMKADKEKAIREIEYEKLKKEFEEKYTGEV